MDQESAQTSSTCLRQELRHQSLPQIRHSNCHGVGAEGLDAVWSEGEQTMKALKDAAAKAQEGVASIEQDRQWDITKRMVTSSQQ